MEKGKAILDATSVMRPVLADGLTTQEAFVVAASCGYGEDVGGEEIVAVLPADDGGKGRVVAALEAAGEDLRKAGYSAVLDLDALTLRGVDIDYPDVWEAVEVRRVPFALTPRFMRAVYDAKEEEYLLDDARKALKAAEEEGVLQVGMASGLAAREGFLDGLVRRFEQRADANFPERDTWIGVVNTEVRIGTKRVPIEEAAAGIVVPGRNAYNIGYLDYDGDPDCTEFSAGSLEELAEQWGVFVRENAPMDGVLYVEHVGPAKENQ